MIAVTGPRKAVVESLDTLASEVEDPEILDIPVTQLDVFVNRKRGIGRTLQELSEEPFARGVYLQRIRRNRVDIPILAETRIEQGDILTLTGSKQHVDAAVAALGQADAPSDVTDMAFVPPASSWGPLSVCPAFWWVSLRSACRSASASSSAASSGDGSTRSGR